VNSSSKQAKKDAETFVQAIWQYNEDMERYMADHLHPSYFIKVAKDCREAGYNNNFTA
jgi:hypothetical protein